MANDPTLQLQRGAQTPELNFDVVMDADDSAPAGVKTFRLWDGDTLNLQLFEVEFDGSTGTTTLHPASATTGQLGDAARPWDDLHVVAASLNAVPYTFPASLGAAGAVLTDVAGSGALTWVVPAAAGNVSNSGTPLDNEIAVWTNATTIEGDPNFTFDGNVLDVPRLNVGGTTATVDGDGVFTNGLVVGFDAAPANDAIRIGDVNCDYSFNGGNPRLAFDNGDRLNFTRGSDLWEFDLAGNTVFDIQDGQASIRTNNATALGSVLLLSHDKGTPATADAVGRLQFEGDDSAGNPTDYVVIDGRIGAATSGSERGELLFFLTRNGTSENSFQHHNINDRTETTLYSRNDSQIGNIFNFTHDRTTSADNDFQRIAWNSDDSGGTRRITHLIDVVFADVTSTTMDSSWSFGVMDNVNAGDVNTFPTINSIGEWTNACAAANKRYDPHDQWWGKESVLSRIKRLPNVDRVYHSSRIPDGHAKQATAIRSAGPSAEDWYAVMGLGVDPATTEHPGISGKAMAAVALAGISELLSRVEALESR